MRTSQLACLWLALLGLAGAAAAQPLTPAFSYQGQLNANGNRANGSHNFEFRLFDAPVGGNQLGANITMNGVNVDDGVFAVNLNAAGEFGPTAFNGARRWLQVRVNGTLLSPRQEILATPYALKVPGLDGHSLDAADGNPVDAVYVDAGGRVGVGTTTPAAVITNSKLDVLGGHIAVSNNFGLLSYNAAGNGIGAGLDTMPDDSLRLYTNGAPHLFILPNGNTGIDASSPAQKLSVNGTIQSLTGGFMFPDGSVQTTAAPGGGGFWSNNGANIFNTNTGSVGVGTNSPGRKVQVGDLGVANSEGMIRLASRSGNSQDQRAWDIGVPETDNSADGIGYSFVIDDLQLGTSPEFIIQWGSGNIGIGVTDPDARLDVGGSIEATRAFGVAVTGIGRGTDGVGVAGFGTQFGLEGDFGIGVHGQSIGNIGVRGDSTNSWGVHGHSINSLGVFGQSENDNGVFGQNVNGGSLAAGVLGRCEGATGSGVAGYCENGAIGVRGHSLTGVGVWAYGGGSTLNAPALRVESTHPAGIGIFSTSNSSDGNLVLANTGGGPLIRAFNGGCCPVFEVRNDGRTVVSVLEVTGADLSERFPVAEPSALEPGHVVAIDEHSPGRLCVARGAYNPRVAGIVSGAGDIPVGAVLGNLPGCEDAPPIALSGRVWCWCDARDHAIKPGDLLTTSQTPGHAMKATDRERSHGAVLGKAMSALPQGERGLVLVLVNLQ